MVHRIMHFMQEASETEALRQKDQLSSSTPSMEDEFELVESFHNFSSLESPSSVSGFSLRAILRGLMAIGHDDEESRLNGYAGRDICALPEDMYIPKK